MECRERGLWGGCIERRARGVSVLRRDLPRRRLGVFHLRNTVFFERNFAMGGFVVFIAQDERVAESVAEGGMFGFESVDFFVESAIGFRCVDIGEKLDKGGFGIDISWIRAERIDNGDHGARVFAARGTFSCYR